MKNFEEKAWQLKMHVKELHNTTVESEVKYTSLESVRRRRSDWVNESEVSFKLALLCWIVSHCKEVTSEINHIDPN